MTDAPDEDDVADRYSKCLAWLSGHFVKAVHRKDVHEGWVWLNRCLRAAAQAVPGEDPWVTWVTMLATQVPVDGDALERVDWVRAFGDVLGADGPLPVQEELPGIVA